MAVYLGYLISLLGPYRRAQGLGWNPQVVVEIALFSAASALVLTRLTFVATYPEGYLEDPARILRFWEGGVTYYGALLGALGGGWAYCRYHQLPFGEVCDLWAPFLAFSHGLGRLGCFAYGCCYGLPTDAPWGLVFHTDPLQVPRVPVQLVEASGELLTAALLERKWRRGERGGRVMLTWFGLYAGLRFGLEFFRGDTQDESFLFGLSLAQSTALLIAAACLVVTYRMGSSPPPDPEPPEEPA